MGSKKEISRNLQPCVKSCHASGEHDRRLQKGQAFPRDALQSTKLCYSVRLDRMRLRPQASRRPMQPMLALGRLMMLHLGMRCVDACRGPVQAPMVQLLRLAVRKVEP